MADEVSDRLDDNEGSGDALTGRFQSITGVAATLTGEQLLDLARDGAAERAAAQPAAEENKGSRGVLPAIREAAPSEPCGQGIPWARLNRHTMWRFLRPAAFLVLGVAALGLVVLNVLAWTGRLVDEAPPPPEAQEALPQQAPPPPEPAAARPAPSTPRNSTVVLTAVRGACWLSVRLGAESGEVLYEGVLAQGDSLRFKRRKLWLRLGAASNLEISVDGKRADVPVGTVDLILPVT